MKQATYERHAADTAAVPAVTHGFTRAADLCHVKASAWCGATGDSATTYRHAVTCVACLVAR